MKSLASLNFVFNRVIESYSSLTMHNIIFLVDNDGDEVGGMGKLPH